MNMAAERWCPQDAATIGSVQDGSPAQRYGYQPGFLQRTRTAVAVRLLREVSPLTRVLVQSSMASGRRGQSSGVLLRALRGARRGVPEL